MLSDAAVPTLLGLPSPLGESTSASARLGGESRGSVRPSQ
jgi:hypothetical protein